MKYVLPLVLLLVLSSCSSFLGVRTKTRKPVSDVKTESRRYTTDRQVVITGLKTEVLDDELNLFKNNGLIRIELEGHFNKESWESVYFDDMLLLEKVSDANATRNCSIEIDIIPAFTRKRSKRDGTVYQEEDTKVYFKTTLEHRLYTGCYGQNTVHVTCAGKEEQVILVQRK